MEGYTEALLLLLLLLCSYFDCTTSSNALWKQINSRYEVHVIFQYKVKAIEMLKKKTVLMIKIHAYSLFFN